MRKINFFALIMLIFSFSTTVDAAIIKYQDTVQTKLGQAVSGAYVEVVIHDTATPATLYTAEDGLTQKTSVTTDSNGTYWFYIEEGRYDLTISRTGMTTQSHTDVIIAGPILDIPHTWTQPNTFSGGLNSTGTTTMTDMIVDGAPYYDIRSRATLTAADAAAVAAGKGLVCASTYTISSATTITASLRAEKGCSFVKSGSGTLTINGPFEAGLYQVFSGFDAGDVTGLEEVYPEWWGAKSDDNTDCIAAFVAAIYTSNSPTIKLQKGIYRFTGANPYGGIYSSSRTVKIYGSGQWDTILKNMSMSGMGIRLVGSFCELRDLMIDNNGSTGSAFTLAGQYSKVSRIVVKNQGGTNYAFNINGATLSSLEDIIIFDCTVGVNFGPLPTNYIHVRGMTIYQISAKRALNMYLCNNVKFYGLYIEDDAPEGSIYIDLCVEVDFYSLGMETTPTYDLTVNSYYTIVNSKTINFWGGRILLSELNTSSKTLWEIGGSTTKNINIENFYIENYKTDMTIIKTTDTIYGLSVKNFEVVSSAVYTAIDNAGTMYAETISSWIDDNYQGSFTINAISLIAINLLDQPINLISQNNQVLINCSGIVSGSGAATCTRIPLSAILHGTLTLTANAATTTVTNTGVVTTSRIIITPTSGNSAADQGSATGVWVSGKNAGVSFVLTHPNNANADKTFDYVISNP